MSSFRLILPTTITNNNNITFTSSSSSQQTLPFLLPLHSSSSSFSSSSLHRIPFPTTLRTATISAASAVHSNKASTCATTSFGNSSSWNFPHRRRPIRFRFRFLAAPTHPDGPDDSSCNPTNANRTTPKSRKDFLLDYVNNVQPEFLDLFVQRAPQQVVEAMRQTVTNMIGTLPPQFFAVTVTTVAENLAQLMYSVIMTGYMFRNAQFRLELQQCLEQAVIPEKAQHEKGTQDYAPGTQKKVTGEVIRWNKVSGTERIDAAKYIELLEGEIEELKRQVSRSSNGQNELLEYLKSLEPQNLKQFKPCLVPPVEETKKGLYFLSNLDQNITVIIQTIYCFTSDAIGNETTVEVLRDAFAKVLVYYYPLAGRLAISNKRKLIVDCTGEGAVFVEAEVDHDLKDISDISNPNLATLRNLVYNVPRARNILEIQLMMVQELTTTAGEDAVLAMNTFVKRLLEVSDPTQMKTTATTTSAPELAKLLYWLMVVGYSIRNIEVRFDMERVLGAPTKLAELPPGENI